MEQQNYKSSDEIDLIYLFNKFCRNLINGIRHYTRVLFRNALLFVSIFGCIAIIGFSLRYFIPHYFKTQAVYVSHYMPANMYVLLLDDLSKLAVNGNNSKTIAEELKIPEETAAAIHAIETQPLSSEDFQYKNDTTAVNAFRITLVLKDMSGIVEIQNGIRNYLESNEYSIKRKDVKRRTLELKKASLVQKSKSLDSLNALMSKPEMPRASGQIIVLGQSFMPLEAYKLQQEYNSSLLQIEQELLMVENIEIVEPFFKIKNYNSPDFNRLFRMSLLLALLLSLIFTPVFAKDKSMTNSRASN